MRLRWPLTCVCPCRVWRKLVFMLYGKQLAFLDDWGRCSNRTRRPIHKLHRCDDTVCERGMIKINIHVSIVLNEIKPCPSRCPWRSFRSTPSVGTCRSGRGPVDQCRGGLGALAPSLALLCEECFPLNPCQTFFNWTLEQHDVNLAPLKPDISNSWPF